MGLTPKLAPHRRRLVPLSLPLVFFAFPLTALAAVAWFRSAPSPAIENEPSARVAAAGISRTPSFHFEAHSQPGDPHRLFLARLPRGVVTLDSRGAEIIPAGQHRARVRLVFLGAGNFELAGEEPLKARVHYLTGRDPSGWRRNVATFARVRARDVYPGIDAVYREGEAGHLEVDFVVRPKARPLDIRLAVDGSSSGPRLEKGDLVWETEAGAFRLHRPVAYQDVKGGRRPVPAEFALAEDGTVGFRVGTYDPSRELVIDPVVTFSTYLGGSTDENGEIYFFGPSNGGVAADDLGNTYVVGRTQSADFPTRSPLQAAQSDGSSDLFVAKFDPAGNLLWSTYLGGGGGETSRAVTVDAAGRVYLAGGTDSVDYPVTPDAFQPASVGFFSGGAVLTVLSNDGANLVYSTYFGSTDIGVLFQNPTAHGVALDNQGHVYLCGSSGRVPVTDGALFTDPNRGFNGWAAKLDLTQRPSSQLIYATYTAAAGPGNNTANGIVVDGAGQASVVGATENDGLPIVGGFQSTRAGGADVYLIKLTSDGTGLVYSTYLGSSASEFRPRLARDSSGKLYLVGMTQDHPGAPIHLPTTPGSLQTSPQGNDGFVACVDPGGAASLIYLTYLGGFGTDEVRDVVVDSQGNACVTGNTSSADFPTQDPLFPYPGGTAVFVSKLKSDGSGLLFSSFLGQGLGVGIAIDSEANLYLTGTTSSASFPTVNSFQSTLAGRADAWVARLTGLPGGDGGGTQLALNSAFPASGGNAGSVTVNLSGGGFQQGISVALRGQGVPDLQGDLIQLRTASSMAAYFDLRNAAPGARDVVVTNPDGSTATLAGGFTIEEGGESAIWVDVIGPPRVRHGRTSKFVVMYGNRGNVDALAVPLTVAVSRHVELAPSFQIQRPEEEIPTDGIPVILDIPACSDCSGGHGEEKWLPLIVPRVPAQSATARLVQVTTPADGEFLDVPFTIRVFSQGDPWLADSVSLLDASPSSGSSTQRGVNSSQAERDKLGKCAGTIFATVVKTLLDVFVGGRCVTFGVQFLVDTISSAWTIVRTVQDIVIGVTKTLAKCALIEIPYVKLVDLVQDLWELWQDCGYLIAPKIRDMFVRVGGSMDPNDKVGTVGRTEEHYVTSLEPLRYAIYFENLPSATFAAQTVVITDQLDSSLMDLDSFSLGTINFGTRVIEPPPGLSSYTTDVDLRPDQNLIVRVSAELDKTSGLLTVTFQSLDPATGEPPTDPEAGFLPPNVNPPEGDGLVQFTVRQQPGLADGTRIRNQARIVFDENAPIDTGVWLNTVDNTPPILGALPDVTAVADSSGTATVHFLDPPAQDAVSAVQASFEPPSGFDFPVGETVVSVTVSDAAGNTTRGSFRVTVLSEPTTTPTPSSAHTVPPTVTPTPMTIPTSSTTGTATPSHSATPAISPPASPTQSATPPADPTPTGTAPRQPCEGDCDGDLRVVISELILGVNIALGNQPLAGCPAFDTNGDFAVTISEIVTGVRRALDGCPLAATASEPPR